MNRCPKCGTNHNKTGIYCCRKCANSRIWSSADKLKKSISAKKSEKVKNNILLRKEKRSIKLCPICNKNFDVPVCRANSVYCSKMCYNNDINKKFKKKAPGGYREGAGIGISGWYRGFYCDSSWELAYVIYCLDNNISIVRNTKPRTYLWKGIVKKYFPDFIVNGVLTEIKGYKTDQWAAKLKYNPDIQTLYKEDLKKVFEFVVAKYGKDFISLYE
jgi:hypothetical protein